MVNVCNTFFALFSQSAMANLVFGIWDALLMAIMASFWQGIEENLLDVVLGWKLTNGICRSFCFAKKRVKTSFYCRLLAIGADGHPVHGLWNQKEKHVQYKCAFAESESLMGAPDYIWRSEELCKSHVYKRL